MVNTLSRTSTHTHAGTESLDCLSLLSLHISSSHLVHWMVQDVTESSCCLSLQPFISIFLITTYCLSQPTLLLHPCVTNTTRLLLTIPGKQVEKGCQGMEESWKSIVNVGSPPLSYWLHRVKWWYRVIDKGRQASLITSQCSHYIKSFPHWLDVALASPQYFSVIPGGSRQSLWEYSLYTFNWSPC